MHDARELLAAIGFAGDRPEPAYWRHAILAPPAPGPQAGPDPVCSAELLRWRDLLAREARPSPYRISRVAD